MKGLNFPVFKTKVDGVKQAFNLSTPEGRKDYFEKKAGAEIEKLRSYLANGNTFVAYLLGKKNSGKGTYSKLFMEAVGAPNGEQVLGHVSVGDIVRDVHKSLESPEEKEKLADFLAKNYRGFHTLDEVAGLIEGRDQSTLISTELILALLKYEISKRPRQALFIDGFPRGLDQVNYAIFLRELLGYREDPDFFIFIDVAEAVIDERIKTRVICPICKTPRSVKLALTKEIGYDETQQAFYLICDNKECNGARMVAKEGDELGIEPIRKRLETDDEIFRKLLTLEGVQKVRLRNSVPAATAKELVDDYEITPAYSYELGADKKVKVIESPWTINDDDGVQSYSLLPAAVVVGMIKQIAGVLNL